MNIRAALTRPESGVAVMLALVVATVTLVEPRFVSQDSLRTLMLALPLLLIVAMGEAFVVIARHVDLSVGSILGAAAVVAGMLFRDFPGTPIWVGFAVAIAVGALLGAFNGLIISLFRLPAIIVTLGTLSLYRGLLFLISDSRQIDPNQLPNGLIEMSQTSAIQIPAIVLIAISVAVLGHYILQHTRFGRQIYALGSNPAAARLRGIRVTAITVAVFTFSGALAGLGGIVYAARFGYVNPGITGVGFELSVIAAIVIGGISINGGVGSTLGVVLGVLLLSVVAVALSVLGISGFWQAAGYGLIILIALLVDRGVMRLRDGPRGAQA